MNKDVLKDLTKSARDFLEIVYPKIKEWFGNGELIPVEAVTEVEMARQLDMNAGIDAWYIENEEGIRGIGSRVQYDTDYSSFTIRKERDSGVRTEFEKLSNAIDNDWLYPFWFCQAYIDSKHLMNAGLCKTSELIDYIARGRENHDWHIKPCENAVFYVVYWRDYRKKFDIEILRETNYTRSSPLLSDFLPTRQEAVR